MYVDMYNICLDGILQLYFEADIFNRWWYTWQCNIMMTWSRSDAGAGRSCVLCSEATVPIEFGIVWFVFTSTLCFDSIQSLMMEPEGGQRNCKRRNTIEFRIIGFVMTCTLCFNSSPGSMMELEGCHSSSVIKQCNTSDFGITWFVLTSIES